MHMPDDAWWSHYRLPKKTVTVIIILTWGKQEQPKYLYFEDVLEGLAPEDFSGRTKLLPELLPRSESIFFVETSGNSVIQMRHLCAVESAAKYHPESQVSPIVLARYLSWVLWSAHPCSKRLIGAPMGSSEPQRVCCRSFDSNWLIPAPRGSF